MNGQVESLKEAQAAFLLVCKVPRILEPEVAGSGKKLFMFFPFVPNLLATNLVHGLSKLSDNVELVEDQSYLRSFRLDRFKERGPHIATDALKQLGSLLSEKGKESVERILGAAFAAPNERSSSQVVDVCQIDMTFLPGNLVNANMGDTGKIPAGQAEGHHIGYACRYGTPGALEQPGN